MRRRFDRMVRTRFLWPFLLAVFSVSANAEERIALVVGNGNYASVAPLVNPVSDASLLADALTGKGFRVTLLVEASQTDLTRAIAQFGRDLRQAGPDATGLFYYAGHGVQSFGRNYLLPVDAQLTDAADLALVALPADSVLRQMFSARNKTNIVILDACRNNPFENIPDMNDNGLAEMKAPTGTFLAYSTAPGAVALDGDDGNSPFTKALVAELGAAGAPIEQVFKQVRVEVLKQTDGFQTPWDTSSLTGDFYFEPPVVLSADEVAAQQLWDSVKVMDDPVQVMLYLRAYPGSRHEADARALLNSLLASELGSAPSSGPTTEEEPLQEVATGPDPRERELIDIAQLSGAASDYEAYLEAFPDGVYAELARFELTTLAAAANAAPEPPAPEEPATDPEPVVAAPEPDAPADPSVSDGSITFSQPLMIGGPEVEGQSIAQIIEGSPLFPPIEGLPEEIWKDQKCSNCHSWTQEALCDQGQTYLNTERALTKQHPMGGGFKLVLKTWAESGCE